LYITHLYETFQLSFEGLTTNQILLDITIIAIIIFIASVAFLVGKEISLRLEEGLALHALEKCLFGFSFLLELVFLRG